MKYIADTLTRYPIPYYINIPKGIVGFRCFDSEEFIFYYPHKQVIYLRMNIDTASKTVDTTFFPNLSQINIIKQEGFIDLGDFKKEANGLNRRRVSKIIMKNNAYILLYNIRTNEFNNFDSLIQSFTMNIRYLP